MATDLQVYGPFEIPFTIRNGMKHIARQDGRDFWADPGVAHLKLKQGCYFFALRSARGFRPWYVGQASKGFAQETFTDHKLGHYNDALAYGHRGTPVLFFVAPCGNKRKVPAKELNHMEKELTQDALAKNPDLRNVQNTKNVPRWTIRGVVRGPRGKPATNAKQFRTMLGLR